MSGKISQFLFYILFCHKQLLRPSKLAKLIIFSQFLETHKMNYEDTNGTLSNYHQLIKGCFRNALLKYLCVILLPSYLINLFHEFITEIGAELIHLRDLRVFATLFGTKKS